MKKRVLSILMMLCLALTLLPVSVWAADSVEEVSTQDGLNAALNNASVTEIHISDDMTYNDPLNATKPVYVDDGVTLTISKSNTTVSGTIVNNGIVKVTSTRVCLWKAKTSGNGKLIGGQDSWGDPST